MSTIACVGCGALVPDTDGPTHRYLDAAWYNELLALEYTNFQYQKVHQLTVDAYVLQHPGTPSPQTVQSMCVHLISLCVQIEQDLSPVDAVQARQVAATQIKDQFRWLEPPSTPPTRTVLDVVEACAEPDSYQQAVREWATVEWARWAAHHDQVRAWVQVVLGTG
jgi:hypothetical protein